MTGLVLASSYADPRRPEASEIRRLLQSAMAGAVPSAVAALDRT
ncbi:hypothetical protein [Streptomyces sp. NPDC002276]